MDDKIQTGLIEHGKVIMFNDFPLWFADHSSLQAWYSWCCWSSLQQPLHWIIPAVPHVCPYLCKVMPAAVLVHIKYSTFVNLRSSQVSSMGIKWDLRMLMKVDNEFVLYSSSVRWRTKCQQVGTSYFRWCWPDWKLTVCHLDNYKRCECCWNRILVFIVSMIL